ncbi:hypothetical protein ACFE04_022228 [Oxalis oulophora]
MSDRKVEPDYGSFGTSSQSYQSAWMAHWKQKHTTSKRAIESRKDGDIEHQPSSSGTEITASIGKFHESGKNSGSRTVSVMEDSLKLKGLKFNEDKVDDRFFPMFNLSRKKRGNVGSTSKVLTSEQNNNVCSLQRLPLSLEDVETMRMSTTVDSVEQNMFGGPSKLHKATHHFLFTKRTGFSLSEGGRAFRESSVSTKFKGKMLSEFHNFSPNFNVGSHHGKETVNSSKICSKTEASAETDTIEMDYIRNNHISDADLSPFCKNIQNSGTSQALVDSTPEGNEDDLRCTNIPDINEEPPALPDDGETSSSKTQSFDMDHLLSHPTNFKSTDDITGPEPSYRWAKRLKKSSKMAENSSHEKLNKFSSPRGSEPVAGVHIGNQRVSKDDASSPLYSVRNDKEILPSHPWIRRWCRSAAPQKKPEGLVVLSEPETSSFFNDFQNKPFPSIAAMALMGKAMKDQTIKEVKTEATESSFIGLNEKYFSMFSAVNKNGFQPLTKSKTPFPRYPQVTILGQSIDVPDVPRALRFTNRCFTAEGEVSIQSVDPKPNEKLTDMTMRKTEPQMQYKGLLHRKKPLKALYLYIRKREEDSDLHSPLQQLDFL